MTRAEQKQRTVDNDKQKSARVLALIAAQCHPIELEVCCAKAEEQLGLDYDKIKKRITEMAMVDKTIARHRFHNDPKINGNTTFLRLATAPCPEGATDFGHDHVCRQSAESMS